MIERFNGAIFGFFYKRKKKKLINQFLDDSFKVRCEREQDLSVSLEESDKKAAKKNGGTK